ncbi:MULTISPECIES: hypothetical protein [Paenibacillus]|uniref:hypothetical protein n=1 Tax=Paenibacillus TaxID=44249 RepID=UPI0030DD98F7
MSRSIRKWLAFLGTIMFASGLAFIIIEEFAPYKTIGIILMVIGIVIILISNFYKEKRSQD